MTTHIDTLQIKQLAQAITVDPDAVLAIQSSNGYFKLPIEHLITLLATDILTDILLDNVDNTSDLDKPISTATATALADKADLVAGILKESQRPDVISLHLNRAAFPVTGDLKKFYIALDTKKLYYYSSNDDDFIELVGSSGSGGTATTFEHVQSTPLTTWTVNHGLDKYPSVTITDASGELVISNVTYTNKNTVVINFTLPYAGTASLI